jgi:lysozyme
MNMPNVQRLITKHEGYRMRVYIDTRNNHTIGIGFNLNEPGAVETCELHGLNYDDLYAGRATISLSDAETIRDDKILSAVPMWDDLPDDAQAVILDMIFNMGATEFATFDHMIADVKAGNFPGAAAQMHASDWYHQVGDRAVEDCALMASC